MNFIHENEVNEITECNLVRDILNPYKRTIILNSHQCPIIHGCMNTQKGRVKFKNFHILLDGRCSSTIIIRRLIKNLYTKIYTVMQWHMQEGNITNNIKVDIYFTLPELSATKIMTWNCHVDESANGRYDMILGINLLK